MKILFVTDNFPPEVNAPATRTLEHARAWVAAGHQVTVITCAPNFPHGRVFPGYRNRLYQTEDMDGIQVVRVWSYMTANAGFAKRVLDYLSFAFSAFFAGLFRRADVIVATSPQFFTTFTGCALSVLKRRPWVFELRDLWPESIAAVGAMKAGRAVRLLERIELFMYRHAAAVVALTPAFKRNLVARGIDPAKIAVVTNGVDRQSFPPRPRNDTVRRDLGLGDGFVIGYIGTMGMAHGLEFAVRAFARIDRPDLRLLLVGDGAARDAVARLAAELDPDRIVVHPPVPKDRVAEMIAACDAALVPLKKSDTFKTVIPSKMFELGSMGKPILLGVEGQAREIVEAYDAGVCFEPENTLSFTAAVATLADDPDQRTRHAAGAERLADAYSRPRLAAHMADVLAAVVARRPLPAPKAKPAATPGPRADTAAQEDARPAPARADKTL
ncbi:glycosyltransferase WbuB [Rhodothalassium salexigens]|uniref:glycosyltransferase family 4 protein n=1 Tax=Rhodothalassium salexigens TaxID=1086 RepID=UPI001914D39B|nr:glycosyltransferase family 4 protein [Rhodothalassium salexigens]MBK5910360.1 glycosyltransferase WbuB [Rhodothalassium salexigens]